MTLRDIRQEEFANLYINSNRKNILNLCPRFGKIRTSIKIFEKIKPRTILIAYPDKKIEESWKDDFKELNFDSSIVTFVSHISLKKHTDKKQDFFGYYFQHLLLESKIIQYKICTKSHCLLQLSVFFPYLLITSFRSLSIQ